MCAKRIASSLSCAPVAAPQIVALKLIAALYRQGVLDYATYEAICCQGCKIQNPHPKQT